MDISFERHKFIILTQEEVENQTNPLSVKEIESII